MTRPIKHHLLAARVLPFEAASFFYWLFSVPRRQPAHLPANSRLVSLGLESHPLSRGEWGNILLLHNPPYYLLIMELCDKGGAASLPAPVAGNGFPTGMSWKVSPVREERRRGAADGARLPVFIFLRRDGAERESSGYNLSSSRRTNLVINTLGVCVLSPLRHAPGRFSPPHPRTHPPDCILLLSAPSLSLSFCAHLFQTINMLSTAAACVPGAGGGVLTVSDNTSCSNNANLVAREDSLSQVRG